MLRGLEARPPARREDAMIAALYVQTGGVYYGLPGVDPWDQARDAREYRGPHRVVAHPPCERWGRYWFGGPSARVRRKKGDDDGCFAAPLAAVRRWGGVLEHPADSAAWDAFGIVKPRRGTGWIYLGLNQWTCCVEQGHYGHRARKATWLYYVGWRPPELKWGPSHASAPMECSYRSRGHRRAARRVGPHKKIICGWGPERAATPEPFRDLLLKLARGES